MTAKKHYTIGSTPTAADLNAPYDELATESGSISDENTAAGWMTLSHIQSGKQCNTLFDYSNDTQTTTNYNSTSYTTISQGGADAEITFTAFNPRANEMTRFCASGLVTEVTCNQESDSNLLNSQGRPNYYAFRLLLTYRDTGAPVDNTTTIGEWGYSFTPRSRNTNENGGVTAGEIQYQTFQFSACHRYDGDTGLREYKKLTLQVKVFDNNNTVGISRHQLFAVSAKG